MYSRPAADQLQPLGHRNGQVQLAGAAALEVVAVVIRARRAARRSPATGSAARSSPPNLLAARPLPSRRVVLSTISTMRGSSRFIRRIVNSAVSMRRSRWCSGGSRPSRLPARALACSSSGTLGAPGRTKPGGRALENRSWSDSTSLMSSCRVTRKTCHAERVGDGAHPVGLTDLAKLWSRIERIAPHVQRRQLRRLGHDSKLPAKASRRCRASRALLVVCHLRQPGLPRLLAPVLGQFRAQRLSETS